MKTKNEKSFEQKTLQLYAREQAIKQYEGFLDKIRLITGFVAAVILLIAVFYYLKPGALNVFSAIFLLLSIGAISMAIGGMGMVLSMGFVSDHRWDDTWKQSFIDHLSQDQKRDIIAAAIPKHIEKCMKNLVASGKSIQLAHKEIVSSKKDIKEYQGEIKLLQELSETIKTKTV